jgi:hypothetical protein
VANALRRAKSSRPDAVALIVALCAGGSGLSRRGMTCLLKLRRAQLSLIEQSRGALVRVTARKNPPLLNLAACADSPLVGDFLSLILLQLVAEYPERGDALHAILRARRDGFDVANAAKAVWEVDGAATIAAQCRDARINSRLLTGALWAALKPLCESVARAYLRHVDAPRGTPDCPLCGGPAYARQGSRARCAVCETAWHAEKQPRGWVDAPQRIQGAQLRYHRKTGEQTRAFDRELFEAAFHAGPLVELVRILETE